METEPSELDFSLANIYMDFFLVLPFLFSPNAVPFSTSKPHKPMKKSNPKQKIKRTLQCVLLLHWSSGEKLCVRSDFHCLKLLSPGFGNWHLGCWVFASFLLSSTGAAARNHTSDPIFIAWSFRRLGLVRIGAWVAGFCIVASFFFVIHHFLIYGIYSSLRY